MAIISFEMPFAPGSRVGDYEIVGPIGQGGMGEVHQARDVRLNRDVALKTLPDSFRQDVDRVARFEREAQTLAALSHPMRRSRKRGSSASSCPA